MIGKLAKAVLKIIMPDVVEHLMQVFKLDKLVNYMELPNDADMIGEKNKEHITMLAGEVSALGDRLKKLETLSNKTKKVK